MSSPRAQITLVDIFEDWMEQAACKGEPLELFFINDWKPGYRDHEKDLLGLFICEDCPVKLDCLVYAVDNKIEYGIWGGLSTKQRKRMKLRVS